MMRAVEIAVTGVLAGLKKLDNGATNIARADDDSYVPVSTQQKQGFEGGEAFGVGAQTIPKSQPFIPSYDPDSPFADEGGYRDVPNVNMTEEAFNIMGARQQVIANMAVIKAANELSEKIIKSFSRSHNS